MGNGYLTKKDIYKYHLLHCLCEDNKNYFPRKRFQFLVNWWNPAELVHPGAAMGCLPLHYAAESSDIAGFRLVFEAGIRNYPKRKGINILFWKCNEDRTPFQIGVDG